MIINRINIEWLGILMKPHLYNDSKTLNGFQSNYINCSAIELLCGIYSSNIHILYTCSYVLYVAIGLGCVIV